MKKAFLIVAVILIFDQALKFWIKTTMCLGQEINVMGDWFIIHFTENPGMAFGMQFAGDYGKLLLSIFRIIAIVGIIYYLYVITRKKVKTGLIASLSLVLAGAMGNMIDSAFYGMIFSSSNYFEVARLFPVEGGYGTFLHGRVVDMFYFPVFQGFYPSWVPFVGGDDFIFFRPVFNIADSSITIGVILMILFQKQFYHKQEPVNETE
ncbi:MAG: lipoprotein signal peptidase [Bacteroidales bacterium]|nr:lipoprotein signal peptidase [Bacteroidales bacterium]MBK9356057.1 lipoprotein signal peptidase [Bacteroidales bacterium]